MKAYLITRGSYSNYHVVAVCLDESVADKYLEANKFLLDYDKLRKEEFVISNDTPQIFVVYEATLFKKYNSVEFETTVCVNEGYDLFDTWDTEDYVCASSLVSHEDASNKCKEYLQNVEKTNNPL